MRIVKDLFNRLQSYKHALYDRAFSDKRLASYLADTFESELTDIQAEGMRFYVKKRIVTVYGTLYSEVEHKRIIRHVSRIIGLEAIVDRIQVVEDVYSEDMDARIYLLLNDNYAPKRLLPA
ncbi:MAG: hypothetical protein KTR29_04130 [Rhodothermaceae bacterium]|nr:hypothetical protein [Rhodothermaceae bacterium]